MIIGITGYGFSGASAYTRVLKEFDDIQSYPGDNEFQIIQEPDGLLDLMYGIVKSNRRVYCNTAVNRFIKCIHGVSNAQLSRQTHGRFEEISHQYLDSLVNLSWNGRSNYDPDDVRHSLDRRRFYRINSLIRALLKRGRIHIAWPPDKKRYFAFINEEEFIQKTKQYINDILTASGIDPKGDVILEQVFNCSDPLSGAEFFDQDVVSLIVDRDPRDLYILTNVVYPEACRFMPNKRELEPYIEYYKLLHYNHVDDPRVKYLKFEELVYRYTPSVKMLEEMLGRKIKRPGTVFKADESMVNTQLFKKYPQCSKEIAIIEKELEPYLYDYDSAEKCAEFKPANTRIY